jgi:hypothetical protein
MAGSDLGANLIVHLLVYCMELKTKPGAHSLRRCFSGSPDWDCPDDHGVCRAISHIVQAISAEPAMKKTTTSPIRVPVSAKWGPLEVVGDVFVTVE